jgi:hypothetical protein
MSRDVQSGFPAHADTRLTHPDYHATQRPDRRCAAYLAVAQQQRSTPSFRGKVRTTSLKGAEMRIARTISQAAVTSLLAGGLALTVVSGTALAAPAQTSNSAGVVDNSTASPTPRPNNNPQFKRGLQDGLRDGNRDGLRQAKKTCKQLNRHSNAKAQALSAYQQGYDQGYTDGFNNGFNAGVRRFCHKR